MKNENGSSNHGCTILALHPIRSDEIASHNQLHLSEIGVSNMNPKHRLIGIAAISLFLSSGSAMATDRKVHNGSTCQPVFSEFGDDITSFSVGILNRSTNKFVSVVCPIVRDNTQNTNGTSLALVNVQSSGGQEFSCRLESTDKNGNPITSTLASTKSSMPVSLNVDVNASGVLGSYTIGCSVPPFGRIFNYDIDEGSSPDFVDTVVPQTAIVSYWAGDRYLNDE